MNIKHNKSSISSLITKYEFDINSFRQRRHLHLIFLLIFFFVGFVMFLIMVRNRKKLLQARQEIDNNLNLIIHKLSIEEYLDFKKRLLKAGRL